MLRLTPRLSPRSLAPLPRTSSLSRRRIGSIGSSSKPNGSPQEPESTTNNASTSPLGSTSAPVPHADRLLSSRALFGSIFALTVLLWSVTRFLSAGQHATHSQPNAAASTTTRDAAATKSLRDRRRLRPDSGGPKQLPGPSSKAIPDATEASVSTTTGPEKKLPAPSPPNEPPVPQPSTSSRSLELPAVIISSVTDRDLPLLREKASAALRAATSAADASQKASSHASSSSLAAKKAAEAAQRASLAASEAQLALEEAAEEAVVAAELRARQAAALASDLEHQALRSSAAAAAFDDLAQLQASIATESAALASSLHRKTTQPATESSLLSKSPLLPSSSSNTALKQHRLAKGFGSDAVAAGGSWLKEMGEGAKESIEGAWKKVSGVKSSSLLSSSSVFKNGTSGKPHGSGREIVPASVDDGRFPPH
jgi:hypothetical protein